MANAAITHRVLHAKEIAKALISNAVTPFAARERYSVVTIVVFATRPIQIATTLGR
jgi:hypothetical protein